MPNPRNGHSGSPVSPQDPQTADPADSAEGGEMTAVDARSRQIQAGNYESTPYRADSAKTSWIEVEMVDEEDHPVAGEPYRVTLPDQSVAEGTLDEHGFARIEGIDPGTCQITFPGLDQEAWRRA